MFDDGMFAILYWFAEGSDTKSLKKESVRTGHCAFLKSNVTFGVQILFNQQANISNQGNDISHRLTSGTGSQYWLAQASFNAFCSCVQYVLLLKLF